MNTVYRKIHRPEAKLVAKLSSFGVATVHEAQDRTGLLAPGMRPIYAGARIVGPGDNGQRGALRQLDDPCRCRSVPAGRCPGGGADLYSDAGYFGELLATSFKARGVLGLIIDAGVRDTRELAEIGFPVWSKAVSAQGTVKETLGSVNVPSFAPAP